jgi:hypothetical protein
VADLPDLLFDYTDEDGINIDVVPDFSDGVEVRIFGRSKRTTTRWAYLPTSQVAALQLALAAHLHAAAVARG